jgi:hypothetical protein
MLSVDGTGRSETTVCQLGFRICHILIFTSVFWYLSVAVRLELLCRSCERPITCTSLLHAWRACCIGVRLRDGRWQCLDAVKIYFELTAGRCSWHGSRPPTVDTTSHRRCHFFPLVLKSSEPRSDEMNVHRVSGNS